jgi:hypothetical protein
LRALGCGKEDNKELGVVWRKRERVLERNFVIWMLLQLAHSGDELRSFPDPLI